MKYVTGEDNLADTLAGYDAVADIVAPTLGPNGRNVRFRKDGKPFVTNDGVTIAEMLKFTEGPVALAAEELIDAAREANNIAGDGTTTTIVLGRALGHAAVQAKAENPFKLREEIQEAFTEVEGLLTASATKLTAGRVLDVARVSVGGNEELAQAVTSVIRRVGKGPVSIESQEKLGIDIEVTAGLTVMGGTNIAFLAGEESITLHGVPILVINGEIATVSLVKPMLDKLLESGITQVVIAATEFSTPILTFFTKPENWEKMQVMPIVATNAREIAIATGAEVVSKVGTATYDNISVEHLGAVKRITVEEGISQIVGTTKNGKHKAAVIKLGVPTTGEYNEKMKRVEDAINAVRAAKVGGVLPGGGTALLDVAMSMDKTTQGAKVLAKAMTAPHRQIRENGFAGTLAPGVIDPLKVVVTALRIAVSTVGTAITTEVTVWEGEEYDWE